MHLAAVTVESVQVVALHRGRCESERVPERAGIRTRSDSCRSLPRDEGLEDSTDVVELVDPPDLVTGVTTAGRRGESVTSPAAASRGGSASRIGTRETSSSEPTSRSLIDSPAGRRPSRMR